MKKFTAVLLTVLLCLSFVSCKTEPTYVPTVSSPSSSEPSSSEPSSSAPSIDSPSSSELSDVSSGEVSRPQAKPEPDPQVPTSPEQSVHAEHYCYGFLNTMQKIYYEAMHTAVQEMHPSWIALGPRTDNYAADIAVARNALVTDHPDVFWLPPYYVTATGKDGDGNLTALMMFSSSAELSPAYLISRSEKAYMEEELESAVEEITSQVTASDPFEIELQLHDLLCSRVEYSDDKADGMVYTAYGALVNGRALCEGYSRAMQLLLSRFGILSTTVTGMAEGEGHMWNQVSLNGNWYNLDVTWNDSAKDFISHEYFNITDSEISLDHSFSKDYTEIETDILASGAVSFNISRPECKNSEDNFFARKGFIYTGENKLELVSHIILCEGSTVEVKFSDKAVRDAFLQNHQSELEEINQEIALSNGEASYYIGRMAVSSLTVRLYKTEKDESIGQVPEGILGQFYSPTASYIAT